MYKIWIDLFQLSAHFLILLFSSLFFVFLLHLLHVSSPAPLCVLCPGRAVFATQHASRPPEGRHKCLPPYFATVWKWTYSPTTIILTCLLVSPPSRGRPVGIGRSAQSYGRLLNRFECQTHLHKMFTCSKNNDFINRITTGPMFRHSELALNSVYRQMAWAHKIMANHLADLKSSLEMYNYRTVPGATSFYRTRKRIAVNAPYTPSVMSTSYVRIFFL
jgi:hypothetical protein